MSDEEKAVAREEIHETLNLCNFCIRTIGLSFLDAAPKTLFYRIRSYLLFIISSSLLVLMLGGEIAYVAGQVIHTATIEEFVGSYLHIAGYDTMRSKTGKFILRDTSSFIVSALFWWLPLLILALRSCSGLGIVWWDCPNKKSLIGFGKLVTIWYKRHTFRQLVVELAEIWPVSIKEGVEIKTNSLSALKRRQLMYAFWNILGVWLYNLTPIAVLAYRKIRGIPSALGYVWQMSYPFDKTKPVIHGVVYVFETCSGCISVCCMLGSDLLFMTMASHISMLLRLLQDQIRHLGMIDGKNSLETGSTDCYQDIVEVVKIHQRLIRYINDLEDAFSVVNLINVLLSSVNICCVMFTIVFLDPWMEMSNKFYLGAALTQMFIVCWYADDIYRASIGVADAVYESGWYKSNTRSRRAMLVVLQRSQRPLYFTALKFRSITMTTYSSILTTAYSYFTLLYTSYSQDSIMQHKD